MMTCHHAIRTEPQFRVRNQTPDPPVLNPSSSSRSLLLPPPPPPRIKTNKKETQKEKENEEHQTLETLERELPPWSEACPSASSRFSPASPSSSSPGSVLSTSRFSSVSSSSSSHSLFLLFLSKCWVFFFLEWWSDGGWAAIVLRIGAGTWLLVFWCDACIERGRLIGFFWCLVLQDGELVRLPKGMIRSTSDLEMKPLWEDSRVEVITLPPALALFFWSHLFPCCSMMHHICLICLALICLIADCSMVQSFFF